MPAEIHTRYLTRRDQPELLDFIRLSYGADYILTDEAFLDWYTHPPRVSKEENHLPIIGAFLGEKLVGHMFVIPHYFSANKKKIPMVWNSNFMVHPGFQQKGIGPAILQHIFRDEDISVSAGTGASLQQKGGRNLLTAMGYNFSFMQKNVFIFRQEALQMLAEIKPEDDATIKKQYGMFKNYLPKSRFNIIDADVSDKRFTDLWVRFGALRFLGTWRDSDFLNWRYKTHPYFDYRVKAILDEKNAVRGFGVYRTEVSAGIGVQAAVARMTDFLAEDGFETELLFAILNDLETRGVFWVDYFTTTKAFDSVFANLGFNIDTDLAIRIPRLLQPLSHADPVVNLVAKRIHDDNLGSEFDDFANWYATSADGDQDRPNLKNHE